MITRPKNILAFDLETTGTDPEKHGILELAMIHYTLVGDTYEEVSELELELSPAEVVLDNKFEVDINALLVNKIKVFSDEHRFKGKLLPDTVLEYLLKLPRGTIPLGKNVHFDVNFLKSYLRSNNITGLDGILSYMQLDISGIVTFLESTGNWKFPRHESRSLGNVAMELGIAVDPTTLHSAMYDARVAALVYFKLLELNTIQD